MLRFRKYHWEELDAPLRVDFLRVDVLSTFLPAHFACTVIIHREATYPVASIDLSFHAAIKVLGSPNCIGPSLGITCIVSGSLLTLVASFMTTSSPFMTTVSSSISSSTLLSSSSTIPVASAFAGTLFGFLRFVLPTGRPFGRGYEGPLGAFSSRFSRRLCLGCWIALDKGNGSPCGKLAGSNCHGLSTTSAMGTRASSPLLHLCSDNNVNGAVQGKSPSYTIKPAHRYTYLRHMFEDFLILH